MEVREQTKLVYTLDHFASLVDASPDALKSSLGDYHARCGEGFALGDRGDANRHAILSGLDNLMSRDGIVTAVPEGPHRPKHTTWLNVPTPLGAEMVMVNCVRPKGANLWKLSGSGSAIPDFSLEGELFSDPSALYHFMVGCVWRILPNVKRGEPKVMRAKVILLGGTLDCDRRLFRARDARDLYQGDFGNDEGAVVLSSGPQGPTPTFERA